MMATVKKAYAEPAPKNTRGGKWPVKRKVYSTPTPKHPGNGKGVTKEKPRLVVSGNKRPIKDK